jgi:hypothetical protein
MYIVTKYHILLYNLPIKLVKLMEVPLIGWIIVVDI